MPSLPDESTLVGVLVCLFPVTVVAMVDVRVLASHNECRLVSTGRAVRAVCSLYECEPAGLRVDKAVCGRSCVVDDAENRTSPVRFFFLPENFVLTFRSERWYQSRMLLCSKT